MAHAKLSVALCLISLILAPAASASQSATLKVALTPERLGGRTTISFAFHIIPHGQPVPSPLVAVNIFYPESIGIVTSGLGTETCAAIQLEVLARCPPNSLLGYGTALVEVPFGPELISEEGRITTGWRPLKTGISACCSSQWAEHPSRRKSSSRHDYSKHPPSTHSLR